jgi:hypothetical protein
VLAIVFVVLLLLGGGAVATWVVVNEQYFVGEADDGEIAIFQGVRGSVFGVSLNRQVQGSCDPAVPTCEKFFVQDLEQLGREAVRDGTESFDNIPEARQFIRDLRTKYPLPPCETLIKAQERSASQTTPAQPPAGGTTTSQPSQENQVEPTPGENCREPREGGG